MSSERERQKRREERVEAESQAQSAERRQRMLQLSAGAIFLAIVVVVVLIVVTSSSSEEGGNAEKMQEVGAVDKLLAGIPQKGLTLGDPSAPVKLYEYGDLQCPWCKAASEEILPQVIENQVKPGKANVTFRNFIIIGPQSPAAGAAAIAAGEQGRGWNYVELFYRNQGKENSGYVTDEFMEAVAEGAGVKDLKQWNEGRKGAKATSQVTETTEQAQKLGFTGTPSFGIEGPKSKGLELLSSSESASAEAIEEAIEKVS